MIGRMWHGWASRENAERYVELLRSEVLPSFERVEGYKGIYLLRKDGEDEVEFVTLTLFENMDAVREFAGADYEAAVVTPQARRLLSRFDQRSAHYEVVLKPALP